MNNEQLRDEAAKLIEQHGEKRILEDLSSGMRVLIPDDDFATAAAEQLVGNSFQPKTTSDMVTFATGIPCVDIAVFNKAVLSGGNLIEVHGSSSSGKTQFCLQACAHNPGSIYVITSGRFPIRRYQQLSGADMASTLIESVKDVHALEQWCAFRLPYLLREKTKAPLIVIDSIASLYRPAFEHGSEIDRANSFVKVVAALKNAALVTNAVIIAVNQVSARPGLPHPVPALGAAWGRCCNIRLELSRKERRNNVRRLRVVHSSFVPDGTTAYFQITENALIDGEEQDF